MEKKKGPPGFLEARGIKGPSPSLTGWIHQSCIKVLPQNIRLISKLQRKPTSKTGATTNDSLPRSQGAAIGIRNFSHAANTAEMMSSRAGSILLRHAGSRLFTAAAISPAAASRPLLAGGNGVPAVMLRLMSTSSPAAPTEAKDEAAKASKVGGDKKAVVINSYWGIEQNNKLARDDGTEWKWTCFRVRALPSGSL